MLQTDGLKLETRRLILRKPEAEDVTSIQMLINNWEIAKWLGRLPWPYPENGAAEWVTRMSRETALGQQYAFGMYQRTLPLDGAIGNIGLHRHDDGRWELGYWLGEPYWGRGLMSEAAPAVVRCAFETLRLERLEAGHFFGNAGSARVLLRCGFEYTGEGRRWCEARGHEVDAMDMELTRAKWAAYQRPQAAE